MRVGRYIYMLNVESVRFVFSEDHSDTPSQLLKKIVENKQLKINLFNNLFLERRPHQP